jgi:hypothetical protein
VRKERLDLRSQGGVIAAQPVESIDPFGRRQRGDLVEHLANAMPGGLGRRHS